VGSTRSSVPVRGDHYYCRGYSWRSNHSHHHCDYDYSSWKTF
jgi:hypothetical protein